MCCIFTCCGWLIDLLQRLWTFTMSCCISSAVCCSFITACMAGIALGYNYSLAEYIDLRETNVSVYLKRGIFDDDIADDMDWRRRKNPIHGQLRSDDLITVASEEDTTPPPSRRKLDDTMDEVERHQNFEGSLMKLTAKPIFDRRMSVEPTMNPHMAEQIGEFPRGSLNDIKFLQSYMNSKKMDGGTDINSRKSLGQQVNKNYLDQNLPLPQGPDDRIPYFPPGPKDSSNPGRRIMVNELESSTINSLRLAVPDQRFNIPDEWSQPKKYKEQWRVSDSPYYKMDTPTYPPPVTLRTGPLPPVRTTPPTQLNEPFIYAKDLVEAKPGLADKQFRPYQKDLLLSDINDSPFRLNKNQDFVNKMKFDSKESKEEEDYEDNFKGLPKRKKRNVKKLISSNADSQAVDNKSKINISSSVLIDVLSPKQYDVHKKCNEENPEMANSVPDTITVKVSYPNQLETHNIIKNDLKILQPNHASLITGN